MRTLDRLVLAALLAVSACSSSKSPWARKMPKAERVAWPTKCGIPADLVKSRDGQGDYAYTSHSGQFNAEPPGTQMAACGLTWNRDKDRLASLNIRFGHSEPALTAAEVEPMLALALAELRPADQEVARRLAVGDLKSEFSGGLEIEAGFSSEHRRWQISVRAR